VGWTPKKWNKAREARPLAAKPLARSENLVVETLGDELLVYDQVTNQAHCLGAAAAQVWEACDGERSVESLSADLGLDVGTVTRALGELSDCSLLDASVPVAGNGGMTRRDLGFRAAKVGAAAATVPLIWSIAAPVPAAALTPTVEQCALYNDESCDSCRVVCGCCCCCRQGGTDPSCKLCFPIGMCEPPGSFTCPGGQDSNCSTTPPADCIPAGTQFNCKKNPPRPGPPAGAPCCTY
jgi:hypothetical protein